MTYIQKHIKTILATTFVLLIFIVGITVLEKSNHDIYNQFNSDPHERLSRFQVGFDSPEKFAQYYKDITTPLNKSFSGYTSNYRFNEYLKATSKARFKAGENFTWEEHGPGNVSGRTRAILVDPDDVTYNTWFAGSASGGIWKTTDGGDSWTHLTDSFLIMTTSTLAMAESNHNIIYAGTGEGFGVYHVGAGIFKSTNKGDSWTQLNSTKDNENFEFVNRIIISPTNADTILAATNAGIFKSGDGGTTWKNVWSKGNMAQDLVADPTNFNILYAGINLFGILKSTDAGETWASSSTGLREATRYEIDVSPVDPNYIYTSVSGLTGITEVYISRNAGQNWSLFEDLTGSPYNYLGPQGAYNNIIAAHPYDKNTVYVGGVDIGKIEFKGGGSFQEPGVIKVDTVGTANYIDFVQFGGNHFGGALATGLEEEAEALEASDWVSVEIRFGADKKQKVHRFTVPENSGSGVPPEDYTYQDYIEAPFEVWDTDNNRQLMVSFRDNEGDGSFQVKEQIYDDRITGREYIFVSALEYDSIQPSSLIAKEGGHTYKLLYFIWPTLPEDSTWQPSTMPELKLQVTYGSISTIFGNYTVLADYRKNTNLHVDHHEIKLIPQSKEENKFIILDGNDGGLGISFDKGVTWEQITNGYNTTQFYGIAKKVGANEYIGGMQDNGTWQTIPGETGKSAKFIDRLEGDGFETLWHPVYKHRILASSQYNIISLSNDNGETWDYVVDGIDGDGPFFTKLVNSIQHPDIVYAVGGRGVYRHRNFCVGRYKWRLISLDDYWTIDNLALSQMDVEISLANDSVVWAGSGMFEDPDLRLFVSKDRGNSFDTVPMYTDVELGLISGIATHPVRKDVAYALFSLKEKPKVLRTQNMGKSWEDISGFGQNDTSANGFPDVVVYSLFVLPTDTSTIWVGTEIGLFESSDNGVSWQLADNGLPATPIYMMKYIDNEVVVATHGRGIWTLGIDELGGKIIQAPTHVESITLNNNELSIELYPNPVKDVLSLDWASSYTGKILLSVYNLNGRKVFDKQLNKKTEAITEEVNLSELNNGIYILTIQAGDKFYKEKIKIE